MKVDNLFSFTEQTPTIGDDPRVYPMFHLQLIHWKWPDEFAFDLMWVDKIVQVRVNNPLVCLVKPYANLDF